MDLPFFMGWTTTHSMPHTPHQIVATCREDKSAVSACGKGLLWYSDGGNHGEWTEGLLVEVQAHHGLCTPGQFVLVVVLIAHQEGRMVGAHLKADGFSFTLDALCHCSLLGFIGALPP